MNADGVVRQVSNRQIEVDVRGKRLRTRLSDLRQPSAAGRREQRDERRATSRVHVETAVRTVTARELVLVGHTIDAALDRAGKFLDDALLADERRLRVVHGHGTGRLREALTTFFREHPLVARVSAASEEEGGRAATIVELKD